MGLSTVARTLALVAFYTGVALFSVRVMVPDPARTVALPVDIAPGWEEISAQDQLLTIALIASNARAFVRAPSTLRDGPQCFPLRRATTLGEHELGLGLLGIVPYLLSGGDPVLTYNLVVLLTLVIAGLAMHALIRTWTGSTGAALIAGTLFATHPTRLDNLQHLFIVANHWTPLALLATERFFTRRTWGWAAALTLFIGLQTLESIYPTIALVLVGGVYGAWSCWRHRRALPALALPLLVVVLGVGATAAVVFGPYLATRALWGTLGGRVTMLYGSSAYAPGGQAFVGVVLATLALVAMLDRLRGRRADWAGDPRLALAAAAALVAWATLASIGVPGTTITVPSLFELVARAVPAFEALRAGSAASSGVILVATILAGFGAAILLRGRARVLQGVLVVLVVAAALGEVFVPAVARASFGRTLTMAARVVRPDPAVIALYGTPADGAVMDVPFSAVRGRFVFQAGYVFHAAYHHRPVTACYNSFRLPLQDELMERSIRIFTHREDAEVLATLGVRDVMLQQYGRGGRMMMAAPIVVPPFLREVGRAGGRIRYRLPEPGPTTGAWSGLAAGAAAEVPLAPMRLPVGAPAVDVSVVNAGSVIYRRPDPIEPVPLVARWRAAAGDVVQDEHVLRYLPAALAVNERRLQRVALTVPAVPGRYRLTLAPADQPDLVIAVQDVEVMP